MFEKTDRRYRLESFERLRAPENGTDNAAALARYRRFLQNAVVFLPPRQRQAVELYYGQGMTLAQIAQTLGVHKSTASRRLCAARRALRELAALCQRSGLFPS